MPRAQKSANEHEQTQWRELLSAGVDGWSSYSDTCSDEPSNDQGQGVDEDGVCRKERKGMDDAGELREDDANGGTGTGMQAIVSNEKYYPSLDANWKQERRDIEWQCLWLELRLKELQSHKRRYAKKLKQIEQREVNGEAVEERKSKPKSRDGREAKMVVFDHPLFDPIRRRREKRQARKRMEKKTDDDEERMRHMADGDDDVVNIPGGDDTMDFLQTDFNAKKRKSESGSGGSDVSNTYLHEKVEVLKKRCSGLMQRLGQPPPDFTTAAASRGAKGGRGGRGGGGGRGSRGMKNDANRTNSRNLMMGLMGGNGAATGNDNNNNNNANDNTGNGSNKKQTRMNKADDIYDINCVVGDIIGAKYVERALHEDINTPSVREVTTFSMPIDELRRLNNKNDQAAVATTVAKKNKAKSIINAVNDEGGDESSDEDISDEAYSNRHAKYEVAERNARMPLELLKKAEREKNGGSSGKGRRGKPSNTEKNGRSANVTALHAPASETIPNSKKAAQRSFDSNSESEGDVEVMNGGIARQLIN